MIFTRLAVENAVLRTNNDTYSLIPGMVASARRPFLGPSLALSAGLAAMGWRFSDLALPGELEALATSCVCLIVAGLIFSKLELLSRDLKHTGQSTVAIGTYRHLKRIQREIGDEISKVTRDNRR